MISNMVSIRGVGKSVPSNVVGNEPIAEGLGVDAAWIEARTGIRERRHASKDEAASTFATEAASRALTAAGMTAADIDLIVVATCTPDHSYPSTAAIVQRELGARTVAAFDLNAACSGFLYAISSASSLLATGAGSTALVIGVDVLSKFTDPKDRQTAALFGDGAGAAVIQLDPTGAPIVSELGADGHGGDNVILPAGGSMTPASHETVQAEMHYTRMAGREVYRSAVRTMSELGERFSAKDFDLVVVHQANKRILEECAAVMGLPDEKLFVNIDRYGNTSAGSIPIALCEAWESGRLRPGDRVLMLSFGAGYTWGAVALTWDLAMPATVEADLVPAGAAL